MSNYTYQRKATDLLPELKGYARAVETYGGDSATVALIVKQLKELIANYEGIA